MDNTFPDRDEANSGPTLIDGFEAYAPELAYAGGGFNPEAFADLARLEAGNFWFQARNELLLWVLRTYRPGLESFLEIGCGTGYVLAGVSASFPEAKMTGSEIFVEALPYAQSRVPQARLIQADARKLPFKEDFEVIGAFDVLEHIPEDETALSGLFRALKPNGLLILTVPQHKWLWSSTDEEACHVRRYENRDLTGKLLTAGFKILRSTSFVSLLLPAMALARLPQKSEKSGTSELQLPAALNALFRAIMKIELAGLRLGLDYPVGGSRLVVALKPDS